MQDEDKEMESDLVLPNLKEIFAMRLMQESIAYTISLSARESAFTKRSSQGASRNSESIRVLG